MASQMEYGRTLLAQLIDALGLGGYPGINRIVVVADIKDVARVYIRRVIMQPETPGVIGAIQVAAGASVEVNEQTHEVECR